MFISRVNVLLAEKEVKEQRQIKQSELARFLNVSRQAVSVMNNPKGIKTLNADMIAQLCRFFDLRPEDYHQLYELKLPDSEPEPPENHGHSIFDTQEIDVPRDEDDRAARAGNGPTWE